MSLLLRLFKHITIPILTEWLNTYDVVLLDVLVSESVQSLVSIWIEEYYGLFTDQFLRGNKVLTCELWLWSLDHNMNLASRVRVSIDCKIDSLIADKFIPKMRKFLEALTRVNLQTEITLETEQLIMQNVSELKIETTAFLHSFVHCCNLRVFILVDQVLSNEDIYVLCTNNTELTKLILKLDKSDSLILFTLAIHARNLSSIGLKASRSLNFACVFHMHCGYQLKTFDWKHMTSTRTFSYLAYRNNLSKLVMRVWTVPTYHWITNLAPALVYLKELHIEAVQLISVNDLLEVTTICAKLIKLCIDSYAMNKRVVVNIAKHLKDLKWLSLAGPDGFPITEAEVASVHAGCPKLTYFYSGRLQS